MSLLKKKMLPIMLGASFILPVGIANAALLTEAEKDQLRLDFAASDTLKAGAPYLPPSVGDITLFGAKVTGLGDCSGDIGLSITNAFTDGTFKRMMSNATSVFKELIGKDGLVFLATLYIQKSNPNLYDLLENGLSLGVEDYLSGVASCEAMGAAIMDYADIPKAQKLQQLQTFMEKHEIESKKYSVEELIAKSNKALGNAGVEWFGEERGGAGQKAIRAVSDSVRHGFCIYRGIDKDTCNKMTAADMKKPITEGSAEQQASGAKGLEGYINAARVIIGDQIIYVCESCENVSEKYEGAEHYLSTEQDELRSKIYRLYQRPPGQLDDDDYRSVSAPGFITLSYNYFAALQLLESDEEVLDIYISGLAYDVAYYRTLSMIEEIGRFMRQAQNDPSLLNSGLKEVTQDSIDRLYRDREILVDNARVRGYYPQKFSRRLLSVLKNRTPRATIGG